MYEISRYALLQCTILIWIVIVYMGKALPKICSICNHTIKGSNWARHTKTHKKGEGVTGKVVKGRVFLKKGRP